MRPSSGFQIVDLAVTLAVAGFVLTLAVPPLLRATSAVRVDLAAAELVGVLRSARHHAVRAGANVAVRFERAAQGEVSFTLYADGDGDGVLGRDVEAGIDPLLVPPRRLEHLGRDVRFGLPPGRPVRDPGDPRRWLRDPADPVRFNRSDLASFGPLGTSTPGSLYLTDGVSRVAVVRVFGRTGKVRVLTYDFATESWR